MDVHESHSTSFPFNGRPLLFLSSFGYLLFHHTFASGVALGGLISIASFGTLQRTIRSAFSTENIKNTKKGLIIVKIFLRYIFIGAAIFVLITKVGIDPVGLALGLSTVVLSIVSLGVTQAWRMRFGRAT